MENITVKIEKVKCEKCREIRTIIEYKEDNTAVLDCGHIVQWNKDTLIWCN